MKKLLLPMLLISAALPAHASDYGCKVLLCLSNPASNGGATGVPECVPPIHQLWDDLDHDRAFPTCDTANGTYVRQVDDPYDPCPALLTPARRGQVVVQGDKQGNI